MELLRVRKRDLPMPLVVEGDDGEIVILSLEPAGKKKLGARLGEATKQAVEWVKLILRRQ